MNIYKYIALISTIFLAVVFQPTFLARLSLPGATPDLVIVMVCCWAVTKGPEVGAIAGFLSVVDIGKFHLDQYRFLRLLRW